MVNEKTLVLLQGEILKTVQIRIQERRESEGHASPFKTGYDLGYIQALQEVLLSLEQHRIEAMRDK